MPQAQEVDRDDQRRVADPRGDPGDVEQRVDLAADGRDGAIDRRRIGQVDLVKVVDLEGRTALVESDDVRPEFGELAHHVFADTRRTSGHHRTAAVVAPQLVDLSQRSALRFALLLRRCAAWTRPSLISAMASGISLAVNLPPRPVGRPPKE